MTPPCRPVNPWPVLEPGDPRSACPRHLYVGAACPSTPSGSHAELSPEVVAARAAAAEKRHAATLARQAARAAAHAEKLRANAIRIADEKRRRAELAAQNKAADLARKAEERRKAQAARVAAKAAKPKPKKAPKRSPGGNRAPAAPAGYVGMTEAARRVGRSRTCLHVAAQEGRLPVVRVGHYVYVRMEDVAAYLEEARKNQEANRERNLSGARARKSAKAKRPSLKLCPRKRGAA